MSRLIDVDELKRELKWLEIDTPVYHDVMSTIDEIATVEVVRCKDCKWYHNANDKYFPRTCDHWSEMFSHYEDWESVDENGFCSWGERREDETC